MDRNLLDIWEWMMGLEDNMFKYLAEHPFLLIEEAKFVLDMILALAED